MSIRKGDGMSESGGGGIFILVFSLIWLAFAIFMIASVWKLFTKAGQPGWAAIVPIYNLIILLKVAGKPGWWFLLFLVPLVNLIISIVVVIAVAQNFGKGAGFAIGMIFLPFIFYPILGFGDAQYQAA
jgi:hypothetical protein